MIDASYHELRTEIHSLALLYPPIEIRQIEKTRKARKPAAAVPTFGSSEFKKPNVCVCVCVKLSLGRDVNLQVSFMTTPKMNKIHRKFSTASNI